nr:hypothetical protein [Orbicella faveolata]
MNKPTLRSDYFLGRCNSTSRSQTPSLINSQTLLRCYPQGNFYLFSLFFSFQTTDHKTHQKCPLKNFSGWSYAIVRFCYFLKNCRPNKTVPLIEKSKPSVKLHGDFSSYNFNVASSLQIQFH